MFSTTAHEKAYYVSPLTESVAYNNYNLPSPTEPLPKVVGQCSCVAGVNAYYKTNFKTLDGYARSIPTSSNLPSTTGFVITRDSWMGHISHYYLDGDFIVIDAEWNYVHCSFSTGRKIPVDSPLIKGYIN